MLVCQVVKTRLTVQSAVKIPLVEFLLPGMMGIMSEGEKRIGVGFGVLIVKDGKVLLGHRHADPAKAKSALHGEGSWTMPGGKLRFGEAFEEGARREVEEETGIRADSFRLVSISNNRVPDAHFVTVGLLAERWEGEPKVMEPDEIVEWRWFDMDALPSPLYGPSQTVLDNFGKGIIYTP